MFFHVQQLINPIVPDEPDPFAANALQEGLGGQFGEMRTMMQYLFQSFNARGDAVPFHDLIQGVGVEEISHTELIATTITHLLDGSPRYQGKDGKSAAKAASAKKSAAKASPAKKAAAGARVAGAKMMAGAKGQLDPMEYMPAPGAGGGTPLNVALTSPNIHHFLVANQGAMPVDSVGNPWLGSYVYASGNLVLDLLYNLMLEATGRLQKCRIYEMSDNKTLRATVSFLIVRDHAHELVFAKALEKLGVNWGKVLPIPKFDATQYPEVRKLMDEGIHLKQHHFRLDSSMMDMVFNGRAPDNSGDMVETTQTAPEGYPIPKLADRDEEFSSGLSPELMALVMEAAKLSK